MYMFLNKFLCIGILTSNALIDDLNNIESIFRKGIYNIINGWRGILSFQYWKVFTQCSEETKRKLSSKATW